MDPVGQTGEAHPGASSGWPAAIVDHLELGDAGGGFGRDVAPACAAVLDDKGALRALERALAAEGVGVTGVVDADSKSTVLRAHMVIVQGALQSLGLVLGVVGALTLASAISLSVVEPTREFGMTQTLGATPARAIWVVVAEALFIGGSSWLAAVALALLLSSLVGALVGSAIFGAPLPLVVSPVALPAWLAVALLGSAAAGALPARAASRLTIRETLAYA